MEAQHLRIPRNQRMDFYRGLAIFAVVFIHVLFPGNLGKAVRVLARFAVPLFFITAGYFSWNAKPAVLFRRALHSFRLMLLACIPYAVLGGILAVRKGESLFGWIISRFRLANLRDFLLYQTVPFPYAWQMWFLGALAGVYLLWWFMTTFYRRRGRLPPYDALAILAAVLLAIHIVVGEGCTLMDVQLDNRMLRSIPLDALPFFALGSWFACHRKELRTSSIPWYPLILGGALLSFAEAFFVGRQELYLGTVVLLFGLMGHAIRYRRMDGNVLVRAIQFCGQRLTLPIYIVHLLIIALFREAPILAPITAITWLLPVLVTLLSALAALGWNSIEKLYRSRKKRGIPHENHRRTPASVPPGAPDGRNGPESGT